MPPNDIAATRRRAALRGDAAVAEWRIKTGTWSARLYAVVQAVPALGAVLWGGPETVIILIYSVGTSLVLLGASFFVARGSRIAAILLLGFFSFEKLLAFSRFGWRGLYSGILIAIAIAFGLVQGVWGTAQRRAVANARQRDEASIVPAAL